MLHSAAHKNNKKLVLGETPLLSLICSSTSSSFGLSGHHRASLQCNSTSVAGSLAGFCKVCEVQELLPAFGIGYIYMWLVDGDNNAPVKWKPYSNKKKILTRGKSVPKKKKKKIWMLLSSKGLLL
jgi:hypothetical protein